MNPSVEEQCVTCDLPEWLNIFNICKRNFPEKYSESVELYEYSMDVFFINSKSETQRYTEPIEMEGRDCVPLGPNMTVVRKVATKENIQLLLTFKDLHTFGDTHHFVEGTMYLDNKKYKVTQFELWRNANIGTKIYENVVMCVFE
jgi:hypothetical protein